MLENADPSIEVEKICTELWDIYFLVIMSDLKKVTLARVDGFNELTFN